MSLITQFATWLGDPVIAQVEFIRVFWIFIPIVLIFASLVFLSGQWSRFGFVDFFLKVSSFFFASLSTTLLIVQVVRNVLG